MTALRPIFACAALAAAALPARARRLRAIADEPGPFVGAGRAPTRAA